MTIWVMVAGPPVFTSTIRRPSIFLAGEVDSFRSTTLQMIQPIPSVTSIKRPSSRDALMRWPAVASWYPPPEDAPNPAVNIPEFEFGGGGGRLLMPSVLHQQRNAPH